MVKVRTLAGLLLAGVVGCSPLASSPRPGPDKQGEGLLTGAALGAGSGAVTGAQFSASAGPGAFIGAGLGGIFGALSGLGVDLLEEDEITRAEELQKLQIKSWIQEVLAEHYAARLTLFPNREIFPADVFFHADSAELTEPSRLLARELGKRFQTRMPWSRIAVTSYITASDEGESFGNSINEKRAQAIALQFVKAGIQPRRVATQSVILEKPLVADPYDSPGRYRQAVEFVLLDQ